MPFLFPASFTNIPYARKEHTNHKNIKALLAWKNLNFIRQAVKNERSRVRIRVRILVGYLKQKNAKE